MIPYSVPHFTEQDLAAMKDCYLQGQIDAGVQVREFERAIAHRLGIPEIWVLCTGSGTAALECASRLRPWSTVAASAMTWPGTYSFLPEWQTIHPLDIDPKEDGSPIWAEARNHDLCYMVQLWGCRRLELPMELEGHLVIDAAHNLFDPQHRRALEHGATVCYSFGPLKELTTGRGGAVITKLFDNLALRCAAEGFLHYGVGPIGFQRPGRNLQMTEPAAAIGLSQLSRWDEMYKHRQRILEVYENMLSTRMITRPGQHSGHLAVARIPRNSLELVRQEMAERDVAIGHHYPFDPFGCPQAQGLKSQICTLPSHLKMAVEDAQQISRDFLEVIDEIKKMPTK